MSSTDIAQAAEIVSRGGVVAYPTEACYGIGCDPFNRIAVQRILRIKSRPAGMGFILIADSIAKVAPLLDIRDQSILEKPLASWPGPYTWIFPAAPRVNNYAASPNRTRAVRVTAHPIAKRICRLLGGALVSTSANRHGCKPLRSSHDVMRCVGGELDFVVRGPVGRQKRPTEIRDAATGRTIRSG